MKKIFTLLLLCFLAIPTLFAQYLSTPPTIDGIVNVGEYNDHSYNGTTNGTWHIGWDDNYLYVAITGVDETQTAILYIDDMPIAPVNGGDGGHGNIVSAVDYNATIQNLPFRANARISCTNTSRSIKASDGANGWADSPVGRSAGVGGFSGIDDIAGGFYATNNTGVGNREMRIAWTDMGFVGLPQTFNFFGYVVDYSNPANHLVSSNIPVDNTVNTNDIIRYFSITDASNLLADDPFSKISYTQNSVSTIDISTLNVYDCTFFSSSPMVVTRSGDWVVDGNVVVSGGGVELINTTGTHLLHINSNVMVSEGGVFQVSGGTTVIVDGRVDLIDGTFRLQEGNTVTVADNVLALSSSSFIVSDNSQLTIDGTMVIANGSTFQPSGTSFVTVRGAFEVQGGMVSVSNSTPLILESDLVVRSASSFVITGGSDLQVGGNLSVLGTFTLNSSRIIFNSLSFDLSQIISGTPNIGFSTVVVANRTNVFLMTPIIISSQLTFTSGTLEINRHNLTFSPTTVIVGASSSACIVTEGAGQVIRPFSSAGTFTFPVKGSSRYSPVTITVNSITGNDNLSINVDENPYPSFENRPIHYLTRYWNIDAGSGITAINYDATFNYVQTDVQGDESQIQGIKFSNGTGVFYPMTVNTTNNTINFTGLTSFSSFTAANEAVLPIALASLSAKESNHHVLLEWTTTDEKNSDKFEIERSINGKEWAKIGSIKAKGSLSNAYNFMDNTAMNGENYYRLKMLDLDEKFTFSNVVNMNISTTKNTLTLSPNPVFDRLSLNIAQNGKYNLFDISGKNIESGTLQGTTLNIQHLQSGVYFLKINNETLRFVKQ